MKTRVLVVGGGHHSVLANKMIETLEQSPDTIILYANKSCDATGMNFDKIIVDECVELGLLCPELVEKGGVTMYKYEDFKSEFGTARMDSYLLQTMQKCGEVFTDKRVATLEELLSLCDPWRNKAAIDRLTELGYITPMEISGVATNYYVNNKC